MEIATSLLLLLTANGAPIIASYLLRDRGAWRVDAGKVFPDHEPLLGQSKTWRGILVAVLGCWLMALLLGYPGVLGIQFASYAMLGDLFSSFLKRRLHVPPSGRMIGLDQVPEALLPLLFLHQELALGVMEIMVIVGVFVLLDEGISRWLYRWHIRNRPY